MKAARSVFTTRLMAKIEDQTLIRPIGAVDIPNGASWTTQRAGVGSISTSSHTTLSKPL